MILRKIEYSQIVRRKMKKLKSDLTDKYGVDFSKGIINEITKALRNLEAFSESGVNIARMYNLDTDYYYLFLKHNYFVYRVEEDRVIIVQMFHEKEDFMMKLFGISGRTDESIDYWGE